MSNTEIVRAMFAAYLAGDHDTADRLLAEDLAFTSPQDDHIDKTAYMQRCFPTAGRFSSHKILQLLDADGDHVLVLYEYDLATGGRYRNVEYITVRDGQICDVQVFFGGPAQAPAR
ncbi:MAG TPA: nuclear transport factor 2 family protein [Jiangellaceae bacterium]|nr:nuclear transport factor 2 family protein [Jiangellaceae bacterium]